MRLAPANARYLFPVVVGGLVLFALCAAMAVFLFREQSRSAAVLQEKVESHRAAADLQQTLTDLATLLRDRVEEVLALNARITQHIAICRSHANEPEEKVLVEALAQSFEPAASIIRKVTVWPVPEPNESLRAALAIVENETLPACERLREYNARRIDDANRAHASTLRWLSWGLAAIGGSAGFAGLVLGYGVARGISRSIQRLQIRVQDAAGKLGNELPTVELPVGGNMDQLDRQVQFLVGRIEEVVARLQQREREVRRAEQLAAVGQLAAGMAHEIRNPLTSIKMLVQSAGEEGPRALHAEDLTVMEREIRRMESTLKTFLDFARPPRPSLAPTDLARTIDETLELARGRLQRQRVEVDFERPRHPHTVMADAGQLRQVAVNLVLNALDAMPGGGRLSVNVREAGDQVELSVRDNGPGIAEEIRDRLFQPFASTRETGLGLGLVISRRIVEEHGGSIVCDPPASGGARFVVRLPRSDVSPSP